MNLNGQKERQSKKKLVGLMNRSYDGESTDRLQAQHGISNGTEAHTLCVCMAVLGTSLKMTELF